MKKLIGIFIILLMVLPTIGLAQENAVKNYFQVRYNSLMVFVGDLVNNNHLGVAENVLKNFKKEANVLYQHFESKGDDVTAIQIDLARTEVDKKLLELKDYKSSAEMDAEVMENLRKSLLLNFEPVKDYVAYLAKAGLVELGFDVLNNVFMETSELIKFYAEKKNLDKYKIKKDMSEEEILLPRAILEVYYSIYQVRAMANHLKFSKEWQSRKIK